MRAGDAQWRAAAQRIIQAEALTNQPGLPGWRMPGGTIPSGERGLGGVVEGGGVEGAEVPSGVAGGVLPASGASA